MMTVELRKSLITLGVLFGALFLLGARVPTGLSQAGSASALIAAVNQLRAANGSPAMQVNNTLMAIAQAHSEYQAAIGTITHIGPGGSRPRDRAIGAGYGGGVTVFVSENIAGGTNLSVQEAVSWWQGDATHLNTMLGSSLQDVGAGVAQAGNMVYYTLVVGYVGGQTSSGGGDDNATGTQSSSVPAPLPVVGVQVATPRPDGSLLHVVQPGQAPISIASAYKVSLADLLRLNGLTGDSVIYPGDRLIIRLALSPTPTSPPTATPTNPPPTRRPTARVSLTPVSVELALVAPTWPAAGAAITPRSVPNRPVTVDPERGPVVLAAVLLAFLALVTPLLVALRRKT